MNWFRRGLPRLDGRKEPEVVLALRAAIVLVAIADAYHDSLLTLIRNLNASTPLAYLGLVPFIALGLAVLKSRRREWTPDVHDRYVDYIVGLPLLLGTLAVVLVGPVLLSTFYWSWRLDLLTLPLFVAGAVTLVFGLRTTARLKVPIVFLFLAWPLPYTLLLDDWIRSFSDATIAALRQIVALIPVARPVDGGDGSLFQVQNGADRFVVSVGSACAGVNGSLGFLLAGGALTGLVRGRWLSKLTWLAAGMVVTWGLNVVRILVIFGAGAAWGEDFAINALHPFFGLVTFNIGVLICILAFPLFRLRLMAAHTAPPRPMPESLLDGTSAAPMSVAPRRLLVQRAALAMVIVLGAGLVVGSATGDRAHELLMQDLGQPRLGAFTPAAALITGWTPSLTNSYPWVRQYFGDGSTWNRYTYLSSTSAGPGAPPAAVTVDVITTYDLTTFSTYGLEACYGFHHYRLLETDRVDLGGGVAGKAIAYLNPSTNATWTAVYWEWPVDFGGREVYERVILNATGAPEVSANAPPSDDGPIAQLEFALASLFGGNAGDSNDPQLAANRVLLLGFGRSLVQARAATPAVTASR